MAAFYSGSLTSLCCVPAVRLVAPSIGLPARLPSTRKASALDDVLADGAIRQDTQVWRRVHWPRSRACQRPTLRQFTTDSMGPRTS